MHNIRRSAGRFYLKKQLKQFTRNSRTHNFTTAASAGIIFHCRHEEEFSEVKEFKKFLESESIRTEVIGYVSDKEVPDHYLMRKGFSFFCQKDLNWYYRPDKPFIEDFIRKEFDILFDLSLRDLFPVNFIVKLSPSSYKIGRYRETKQYDLMIDIDKDESVQYLLQQIRHYLSILHTKSGVVHAH
jgi:hypothetical protein